MVIQILVQFPELKFNITVMKKHFISLQKGDYKPSPSKIESLVFESDKSNYVRKREIMFLSLGEDISTASVGAQWDDKLLIGSITDDKIYVCQLGE